MGNRAVITTQENFNNNGVGIYLHWNGGIDSVIPFLDYLAIKRYRKPYADDYGWAMLTNIITNFFGDGLSCGVDTVDRLDCDNRDNGVYIIGPRGIERRIYAGSSPVMTYKTTREDLEYIDAAQPERMKLTPDEWKSWELGIA